MFLFFGRKKKAKKGKNQAKYSDKALFKRVWRESARPYLRFFLIAALFMILAAALEAAGISMLQRVVDKGFIENDMSTLKITALFIVVIYFFKSLFDYLNSVIMMRGSLNAVRDLRRDVFNHIMNMDMGFFGKNSVGYILSRLISDTNSIVNSISTSLINVFKNITTALAMFGVMIYFAPELFLIALGFMPFGYLIVVKLRRKNRTVVRKLRKEGENMTSYLVETLKGVKVIKSYNLENDEKGKKMKIINSLADIQYKSSKISARTGPMMEILSGIIVAVTIIYGGNLIAAGSLTTGAFITFFGAWGAAYKPLRALGTFNVTIQQGINSAERIYEFLDTKPLIKDKKDSKDIGSVKTGVKFNNVTFAYDENTPVLRDLSLNIPKGKVVALVGPSGGGKSTIMNLIPRFYDVKSGSIEINGKDIRDFTQKSLRENMAFVGQEVFLFHDTIANNISIGKRGKKVSKDQIIKAAKMANAHEFIEELPDGYDTIIEEDGSNLSGGQRQRISIARAILKDAPILLLDEATSALDTESEKKVQDALEKLSRGRTTLVIAHRLSTVMGSDLIYVIDGGGIAERGTHKELLQKKGLYKKFYEIQFKR